MKRNIKRIGALLLVMVVAFFGVAQVTGHVYVSASTVRPEETPEETAITSPLYEVRIGQAKQVFAEMPNIATDETTIVVNGGDEASPQIIWSGHLSACILSGCVFSGCFFSGCKYSGCVGSGCKYSGCVGSGCVGSGCPGSFCGSSGCFFSGCKYSGCTGSGCGFSGCIGSGCGLSGCIGSGCLGCK